MSVWNSAVWAMSTRFTCKNQLYSTFYFNLLFLISSNLVFMDTSSLLCWRNKHMRKICNINIYISVILRTFWFGWISSISGKFGAWIIHNITVAQVYKYSMFHTFIDLITFIPTRKYHWSENYTNSFPKHKLLTEEQAKHIFLYSWRHRYTVLHLCQAWSVIYYSTHHLSELI